MATGLEHPADQSTTSLVSGILADLQNLVEQQFLLIRRELERDVKRGLSAASMLLAAVGIAFLSGFSFCLAAAEWLYWLTAPVGTDPGSLPIWGCHAIVAVLLLAIGAVLAIGGRMRLKNIKPLESPAAEALKENVEWTTNAPLK
jgi:hypothetical protein